MTGVSTSPVLVDTEEAVSGKSMPGSGDSRRLFDAGRDELSGLRDPAVGIGGTIGNQRTAAWSRRLATTRQGGTGHSDPGQMFCSGADR